MSYNIDSVDIVYRRDFRADVRKLMRWARMHEDELPECCLLHEDELKACFDAGHVRHFWWQGEGSGRSFDLLKEALAKFDGQVDLVICWEGGDKYTGLRLRDHKVTEHEVVMALGGCS